MKETVRTVLDAALDWVDDNRPRLTRLLEHFARAKAEVEFDLFSRRFAVPPQVLRKHEEEELLNLDEEIEELDEEVERLSEEEEAVELSIEEDDSYYWGRALSSTKDTWPQAERVAERLKLLVRDEMISDLELVGRVKAIHGELLLPVATILRDNCMVKRAKDVLQDGEIREAVLVHSAATFAKDLSWSPRINEICWPHKYWASTTRIEEFIYKHAMERTYFNPHALEQVLIRELSLEFPGFGCRPYHWRNVANRLISKEEFLIPVIGTPQTATGGYFCAPHNYDIAHSELEKRIQSYLPYSAIPEKTKRQVERYMNKFGGKVVRDEDVLPIIAKIIEHDVSWADRVAPKAVVISDTILDAFVSEALILNDAPRIWTAKEKAYHFDRIYESVEPVIDE